MPLTFEYSRLLTSNKSTTSKPSTAVPFNHGTTDTFPKADNTRKADFTWQKPTVSSGVFSRKVDRGDTARSGDPPTRPDIRVAWPICRAEGHVGSFRDRLPMREKMVGIFLHRETMI